MIACGEIREWHPGVSGLDGLRVKVVGIASRECATIGYTYIIDLMGAKITGYPYTHSVATEISLWPECNLMSCGYAPIAELRSVL
jgi:hypothetical protein